MGPTLREALELIGRPRVLADPPERLAVPEQDVTIEPRSAAGEQISPRPVGLLVAPERVQRERQTMPPPDVERRRGGPREHTHERLACARAVAEPERRPPARVERPRREVASGLVTKNLTEEPVGLLDPVQAEQGLGEPVARVDQDV